jgi:hypothetical protein
MPFAIGIGIPALVLAFYFVGRRAYGERWYLALGKNSTWGDDDPAAEELEELRFTALHLSDRKVAKESPESGGTNVGNRL